MSTWLSQPASSFRRPWLLRGLELRRPNAKALLLLGCLVCILVVQGVAITYSYLWAAPLACLLVVSLATDIPLVPTVGIALLVRVLSSQAVSSARARYSESLNLSGLIAVLFIILAVGLLLHRRKAASFAIGSALALSVWTLIAIQTHGESNLTLREGVREASIIAIPIIVWNARGAFSVSVAARIVQIAGFVAALVAIYQFATHTGLNVGGNIRSDGTFTHPNGAAMYFAIAVTASLWRYFDQGRRLSDALLAALFAVAAITTFSVGGFTSLLVMLITFGLLRPGSLRLKLGSCALAGLAVVAFIATPLGAKRIATESATSIQSAETRGTANTSLAWRFYKWRTLLPEWEQNPAFGRGLGTTVTAEGNSQNVTAGNVPHNEYVRYLVETGAIGLVLMLWALIAMIRRLARGRRIAAADNATALGLGIVAGCMFNALGDNTFLYSTTGYAAALIVAAVLCSTSGAVPMRSVVRST
jgi:O-antigen ligase